MMHQSACPCERFDCPGDQGDFYVSARYNGQHIFLLGPFPTHEDALEAQPIGERLAYQTDHKACWYAYGTARTEDQTLRARVLFQPCPDCGEIKYYRAECACKQSKESRS